MIKNTTNFNLKNDHRFTDCASLMHEFTQELDETYHKLPTALQKHANEMNCLQLPRSASGENEAPDKPGKLVGDLRPDSP